MKNASIIFLLCIGFQLQAQYSLEWRKQLAKYGNSQWAKDIYQLDDELMFTIRYHDTIPGVFNITHIMNKQGLTLWTFDWAEEADVLVDLNFNRVEDTDEFLYYYAEDNFEGPYHFGVFSPREGVIWQDSTVHMFDMDNYVSFGFSSNGFYFQQSTDESNQFIFIDQFGQESARSEVIGNINETASVIATKIEDTGNILLYQQNFGIDTVCYTVISETGETVTEFTLNTFNYWNFTLGQRENIIDALSWEQHTYLFQSFDLESGERIFVDTLPLSFFAFGDWTLDIIYLDDQILLWGLEESEGFNFKTSIFSYSYDYELNWIASSLGEASDHILTDHSIINITNQGMTEINLSNGNTIWEKSWSQNGAPWGINEDALLSYDGLLYLFFADFSGNFADRKYFLERYNKITSVHENASIKQAKIYPNPTQGTVLIESNDDIEKWQLLSTNGQILSTGDKQNEVHLDGLPDGMYLLKLTIDGQYEYHKISLSN